ncbi:MAG: shikimate kinase [Archaeoglobaceae archaeon]
MKGKAYAAGTVLNALATGIGCAFGIELFLKLKIKPDDENVLIVNGTERKSDLIEKILSGLNERACVIVKSEIPEKSGLGSSSAFLNALLIAIYKKKRDELIASKLLKLNAEISLEVKISYTGAFDDASASLLGGLVISDNYRRGLKEWIILRGYAAILLPEFKRGNVDWEKIKRENYRLKNVELKLKRHEFREVMRENTRFYCEMIGYPLEIAERLWKENICCGLSGNGPSFVAIGNKNEMNIAKEIWEEYGKVIVKKIPEKPVDELVIDRELFLE